LSLVEELPVEESPVAETALGFDAEVEHGYTALTVEATAGKVVRVILIIGEAAC